MSDMTGSFGLQQFRQTFGLDEGMLPDVVVERGNRADWDLIGQALDRLGWYSEEVKAFAIASPKDVRRAAVDPIKGVRFIFTDLEEPTWDFDPREITTQEAVDSLMGLAAAVGEATRKSILFVPEGMRLDQAVLRYEPGARSFVFL